MPLAAIKMSRSFSDGPETSKSLRASSDDNPYFIANSSIVSDLPLVGRFFSDLFCIFLPLDREMLQS
jgi:hypothetical protein